MTNPPSFSGSESAAEIAKAAIEWVDQQPHEAVYMIIYEDSIPKMKYKFDSDWVQFECVYRIDKMLESFYVDAEQIYDENVRVGLIDASVRNLLLPYIAFSGMTAILSRMLILQSQIFLDTIDEAKVVASGIFLHSLATQSTNKPSIGRFASKIIQGWIDECVSASLKKKREFLVGYMNTQRLINIPTAVGRPQGSTKSAAQKAQEASEFEKQVEEKIREMFSKTSELPTKTAVAKALGIGGLNPKSGVDSSLTLFGRKLKHFGIDYEAVAERAKLHE